MDTKSFSRVEIKSEDKGQVSAVFATFNVVDKDGDVTLPGAFEHGAQVLISDYGHKSWPELGHQPPVGKGYIRVTPGEAILEGKFFMDTEEGRNAFHTVKGAGSLQEWSYGYQILDASPGDFQGKRVQFLKRLSVKEVSPVFEGAGVNTRTLSVKSSDREGPMPFEYRAAIRPHDTKTVSTAWDSSSMVKSIPDDASVSDLRSVFAWVNPGADPEFKSSYAFPHHSSVGGPANIRACVLGIAAINGARGGTTIPEVDRKGVYNHLAAHLRDADREPPELRSGSADGLKTRDDHGKATIGHYEEIAVILSDFANLNDRTAEIVALRSRKGRTPLPAASTELLMWLEEETRRLKSLLTSADEEARYEYLRFLRSQLGE